MTTQDKNQQALNRAKQAQELQDNPLLREVFITLQGMYFDKLVKLKKSEGYESELKDIHESMQNLNKIEAYIDRCVKHGKVIVDANNKPSIEG